jgi:anti-sigma factor RsiW
MADVSHPTDAISALLDGALPAAEAAQVERHLAGCAECRTERDALGAVRTAVRSLPALEPPPWALTTERLARRPRRGLMAWAASGIAAAALGIGLIWGPGEPKAAVDLDTLAERHTARVVVDPGISTLRGPLAGR